MLIGIDTSFLVQFEIVEAPNHQAARDWLSSRVDRKDQFGIAPQVLFEFIHVVTDSKRFCRPLSMKQALVKARAWWIAAESRQLLFNCEDMQLFGKLMENHQLGRKRILDTALAATFLKQQIWHIASYNWRDFAELGKFKIFSPGQ